MSEKKKLTDKKERFCQEFLVDLNQTQSAIRAGFSKKTAYSSGNRLLKDVGVKERIEELMLARSVRTQITADNVLRGIAFNAFSDMADYVDVDEIGCVKAKTFDQLAPGASRSIKKIREKKVIKSTDSGDTLLESTFEFELNNQPESLRDLGRHLKLFTDKHELSGELEIKGFEVTFVNPTKDTKG